MSTVLNISFPGNKQVHAELGGRIIETDQRKTSGGDESAPEPFQLFLASIGTCAGIYALSFCQSRNMDTSELALTMTCDFDPEKKQYSKISLDLKLPADFPDNLKPAIIRAMDLCAVKKHIINPPEFAIQTS